MLPSVKKMMTLDSPDDLAERLPDRVDYYFPRPPVVKGNIAVVYGRGGYMYYKDPSSGYLRKLYSRDSLSPPKDAGLPYFSVKNNARGTPTFMKKFFFVEMDDGQVYWLTVSSENVGYELPQFEKELNSSRFKYVSQTFCRDPVKQRAWGKPFYYFLWPNTNDEGVPLCRDWSEYSKAKKTRGGSYGCPRLYYTIALDGPNQGRQYIYDYRTHTIHYLVEDMEAHPEFGRLEDRADNCFYKCCSVAYVCGACLGCLQYY